MNRGQQHDEGSLRRPSAARLASITRDYASRIDECAERRHSAEQNLRRPSNQRKSRPKPDYHQQQVAYNKQLKAARLDGLWSHYASLHPGADFTHALPFLGWAHTTGAYPHGKDALTSDWQNAASGQPAPERNATRPTPPHQPSRPPRSTTRPSSTTSTSRPTRAPTPTPQDDRRAPLNTRNLVLGALITGAIIIAAAAMVINP